MKKICSIILGLVLVAGIGITFNHIQQSEIQAKTQGEIQEVSVGTNYKKYESIEELDKDAELILIGNTKTDFMQRQHHASFMPNGALADFYTLTDFNVKEVVKQPKDFSLDTNKVIKIIEPASFIEEEKIQDKITKVNTIIKDETYEPLEKNIDYVVFLKRNDNGEYSIINMYRGKFEIKKDVNPNLHEDSHGDDITKPYLKMKEDVLKKYSAHIEKVK